LNIVVTGGAGFIGSNFVKYKLNNSDDNIIIVDKLTYAGNPENIPNDSRVSFLNEDICNISLENIDVDCILNFAAETHVDRSISEPESFIKTDVFGTFNLLEIAKQKNIRYVQISTDEVYGSIEKGSFTEQSPIKPSSPYSASKTGGDMLVYAYHETYGLDSLIVRGSNNYGPNQYPEKLIPLVITKAINDQKIPVYGNGMQVRNWIFVEDFCFAIDFALKFGKAGEVYNAGGPSELTNLEVIGAILEKLEKPKSLINFIEDRLGHDKRYSLASDKIKELGWEPKYEFNHGIDITVDWYLDNFSWWNKIITEEEYGDYYKKQYRNN
jgi:dTDP-glucose 4,6-dehydratase